MNTENRQTIKVAIAIFAGALIGSIISLYYLGGSVLSLVIGMLVGGLVGYVAYEPMKVLTDLKKSITSFWEETEDQRVYRLERKELKKQLHKMMFVQGFAFAITFFWPISIFLFWGINPELGFMHEFELCAFLYLSLFFGLPFLISRAHSEWSNEDIQRVISNNKRYPMARLKYTNPISLPFVMIYFTCKATTWIAVRLPGIVVSAVKLIHCEARVQSASYAVIGTAIGWYLKAPVTAAVIGAVIGAVGYQLVTKRLLKVKA